MAKVLVVYYSRSGNTEEMARCVARGVAREKVEADLKKVEDVEASQLKDYDGIVVGSPTYYGTMAAELKQLIDEAERVSQRDKSRRPKR